MFALALAVNEILEFDMFEKAHETRDNGGRKLIGRPIARALDTVQ